MAAACKTYDRSQQRKAYFCTLKRINITSNVQYFVEKYLPATSECSLCGMDAYIFLIYSINRDLQILQAAARMTNSARVLIPYVSICSFSLTARHTFSVTFKSGDWDGPVVLKILLLVFKSRGNLSTVCRCMSSLNIKGFPRNLLQQKTTNSHAEFSYTSPNQNCYQAITKFPTIVCYLAPNVADIRERL